jgi:hypothetical protein
MKTKAVLLLVVLFFCCSAREGFGASLMPDHTIKLWVQNGYLPQVPVLVRVELRNAAGEPDREVWDTNATLSADQPGITLSTNRVVLHNGLGSALVTFTGGGDFNLIAAIGSLLTNRPLQSLAGVAQSNVSGTLPAGSNSWSGVVRVTNDVTVPSGSTLAIQPNTLVLIDGVSSGTAANDLIVAGTILTLGTEEFPVTITCSSGTQRWGQIRHNTAQPSIYRFTSITRGGRAAPEAHTFTGPVLRPTGSKITFENCNITDHAQTSRGTGFGLPGKAMYALNSDVTFVDCLLSRCRMGPEIDGTALRCTNTYFMEMVGPDDADGIYLHTGQSMSLENCVLAYGDDDGIDTLGATVNVSNCIIRDWSNLLEDAKGISVFNGATDIRHCLIVDSTVAVAAKWSGGAATRVTITESTITGISNSVLAAFKANAPGPFIDFRITNSILRSLDAVKSDFGLTNFTIRYCNISEEWPGTGNGTNDPLFVSASTHDFRLLPYSPCIDAGNPASLLDSDGSGIDIGYFTFLPPAPTLSQPVANGIGPFEFVLNAYSNRNYVVEFSTNLLFWTGLTTNFQSGESLILQDTSAGEAPMRVYRAHLAP